MTIDISPIIIETRPVTLMTGPRQNFSQAVEWAAKNGTRLFTRAEVVCLYEISQDFRDAVRGSWFWVTESATVLSYSSENAWVFTDQYGGVTYYYDQKSKFSLKALGA